MTLSLEQLSARMRQGEDIPLSDTARIALALSIPSILEQLVVTAMEYIDAAMVGHIGAAATASIGIVSSSTWLVWPGTVATGSLSPKASTAELVLLALAE